MKDLCERYNLMIRMSKPKEFPPFLSVYISSSPPTDDLGQDNDLWIELREDYNNSGIGHNLWQKKDGRVKLCMRFYGNIHWQMKKIITELYAYYKQKERSICKYTIEHQEWRGGL